MRGTRWLVLVALAVIVGGISVTYRAQKRALQRQVQTKPPALPLDLNSSAEDWHWSEFTAEGNRTTVEVKAKNVKQIKDDSRVELEGVELRIHHKDDESSDVIKSARASFSATERKLYSEGEVEITLGVPKTGATPHRLVSIRTSGVSFDATTGQAETDHPSSFVFERGEGKCVGAFYDPPTRTLRMKTRSEVIWRGRDAKASVMKMEAEELQYHEAKAEIWLQPWSRLTRGTAVVEGGLAVIHLQDGVARFIEAKTARGSQTDPNRKLEYAADFVTVHLNEDGVVERVNGDGKARVVSATATSHTTLTGGRVHLEFVSTGGESTLKQATGFDGCTVESKPVPMPGRQPRESHVLRADSLRLMMRPGGEEIETAATDAPGDLEFLPNLPTQHRRKLTATRMYITYGPQNRIESFRGVEAKTRTEPTAQERKRNRAPVLTASRNLLARFDVKTGRMASLEQWDDFTYEEGERRARAARAVMDGAQELITLETGARMWDESGTTTADRIHIDQKSGTLTAEGRVNSSRLPEKDKKKQSSQMLSGDEPVHATALRMISRDHHRRVRYEGGAVMWQGANRIVANTIDVDREKRSLVADGSVQTHLWEQERDAKGPRGAAVLTVVRARHMVYTEADRLAHYTGGVLLTRSAMQVKAAALRAFLSQSGSDSSLEKAYADGDVEIVQSARGRTRTGVGGHAEYFTSEQKVTLRGGEPRLVDSLRGTTRGSELTYFANDDRLLVNGAPDKPAVSRIRRDTR